jgi:hypothetical protein
MAHRSPIDGEIVGVHRVYLFPPDNLHGEGRWLCVTEHDDGSLEKQLLPAGRPRPEIGDKR